jgi:hypothetical protein
MNKRAIAFHLKEAQAELNRTIREIETNGDYEDVDFQIAMAHLYHHLNTAWNGRDASEEAHRLDENFDEWRKFPSNANFLFDA